MPDSHRRRGGIESGLSRWSRLKRAGPEERDDAAADGTATASQPPPATGDGLGPPPTPAAAADRAPMPAAPPAAPPDLPSLESLDAASDYRVFLQAHVPEELRRQALRLLWRSDPVLANLDGLNDYDEDYRRVGMVTEVVRTAYRVGKGYLSDAEAVDPNETEPSVEAEAETVDGAAEAASGDEANCEGEAPHDTDRRA